jgi:bisanhydrobacterioruberin hydratase
MNPKTGFSTLLHYLFVPYIALPLIGIFYIVGLTGHLYQPTFDLMLDLTPFVILIFGVWAFAAAVKGARIRLLIWALITYLITFTLEAVGVATGTVFGEYWYGETLGVQLFEVPLVIGFNWTIIIMGLSDIIRRSLLTLQSGISKQLLSVAAAFFAALGAVIFDVIMEPVAMAYNYWQWGSKEVPLHNYIAWFIIAFIFSLTFQFTGMKTKSSILPGYIAIQALFFLGLVIGSGLSLSLA